MSSRTWYFVRHGETEWNAESRLQGQLDSPLTTLGRAHAKAAARLLADLGVDAVFASPLGRVRETVALMGETLTLPVTYDDRLKEWSAGEWGGVLHADLPHRWPVEWAAWNDDRYRNRPPGGETFLDLEARARAFVDAVTGAAAPPRVAVIAHGFLNRALAAALLSLTPADVLCIRQGNDVVIRVIAGADRVDVDHFVDGRGPFPGLPAETLRNPAVP